MSNAADMVVLIWVICLMICWASALTVKVKKQQRQIDRMQEQINFTLQKLEELKHDQKNFVAIMARAQKRRRIRAGRG